MTETVLEQRKEKLKKFFSDKHNLILTLILLFAFAVRIYYFFQTVNQPVWWDEAQYAEQAKRIGLGLGTDDIWYYRRTMFLPLFWSLLFKIGFGETALRFTEVLFSVLLVFATYLLGKELFNKKVGLIAALGISFSRRILFETSRLLNSVPAAPFIILAFYFFYKGYMKENNPKYLYLFGLFTGISMEIRFANFLMIISFALIYLLKEKFKIWKNLHMIGAFLLILLILSPFFVSYYQHYPQGISDFLRHYGEVGVPSADKQPYLGVYGLYLYFLQIPNNLSLFLFIAFLIGALFLLDFLLAPDLLLKDTNLQKNLFLFLFVLPAFIYHSVKSLNVEERYLIGILPVLAIIAGYGIYKLYNYLKNYNKPITIAIITILLLISAFYQVKEANDLINSKKDSYFQVKEAALWMKANSKPGDIIISNSIPQTQYYSERTVYYKEDEKEVESLKPKFYTVSIFEKSSDSYYAYPDKHKDKLNVVQVYFMDQEKTKPSLVIYQSLV